MRTLFCLLAVVVAAVSADEITMLQMLRKLHPHVTELEEGTFELDMKEHHEHLETKDKVFHAGLNENDFVARAVWHGTGIGPKLGQLVNTFNNENRFVKVVVQVATNEDTAEMSTVATMSLVQRVMFVGEDSADLHPVMHVVANCLHQFKQKVVLFDSIYAV